MCIAKIYDAAAAVGTDIDYIKSCSSQILRKFDKSVRHKVALTA